MPPLVVQLGLIIACIVQSFVPTDSIAADIYYVGDQSTLQDNNGTGSYHDGLNWLNYHSPGGVIAGTDPVQYDDADGPDTDGNGKAVFDIRTDHRPNNEGGIPPAGDEYGLPSYLYFGDFTDRRPSGDKPVPGGIARPRQIDVTSGEYTFDLGSNNGGANGKIEVEDGLVIGNSIGASADLTIRNGRITTGNVSHLSPDVGSNATVTVDGPAAEWISQSYVNVGWVGDGRLTIQNGALMHSQLELHAGIRNGSSGTIEVLSGGALTIEEKGLSIGSGREATGQAIGTMRVQGAGSYASAPNLQVGGGGGAGVVNVSNGGELWIAETAGVYAATGRESELRVSGSDASLEIGGQLVLRGNSSSTMFIVENGATAHASFTGLEPFNSEANATIVARSGGLLKIDSFVGLSGNGVSVLDVATDGRLEVGAVDAPANLGEIRIGAGGSLRGSGSILGDLTVEADGVFEPGFSPGIFNIAGDLAFLDERSMTLEIGGTAPGSFDQINVTGDFSFSGTLFVSFINGFVPSNLDSFDLITVGGESLREFDIQFQNVPQGLVSAQYLDGAYRVTAVPEPSTACLMVIAFFAAYPAYCRSRWSRAG